MGSRKKSETKENTHQNHETKLKTFY